MRLTFLFFIFSLFFTISGCANNGSSNSPEDSIPTEYTAFANPEPVTILGYNDDAMEPFISRDGRWLFFNSLDGPDEKDIFYATLVDDTTFEFQGTLSSINTIEVDGTPTMDASNNFYYISTLNYDPPNSYDTIYKGVWNESTVIDAAPLTGIALDVPGILNFDVEVSSDGSTLFFNDGDFSDGNGFPGSADISIADKVGDRFERDPNSDVIMENVNTENLEYAPAISANGLELFFTRLDLDTMETYIYRTERPDNASPFDMPQLISAINGFVEGPTLSPDEKSLYYHKKNTTTGLFEIFRVTRP